MSDVSKTNALIETLRKAHDASGRLPQGTMDHETQWRPFANLYNAAEALLDALEAATRVPVQGEPNDDREVLDNVLIDAREAGDGLSAVRNRILAAGFSRPTVPEAATERYKDAAEGNRIRLVHAQDDAERFEAERDAALAAVERVRLVVDNHRSVEQHNEMVPMSDIADLIREPSSADYLSALDVAPEPEVKP